MTDTKQVLVLVPEEEALRAVCAAIADGSMSPTALAPDTAKEVVHYIMDVRGADRWPRYRPDWLITDSHVVVADVDEGSGVTLEYEPIADWIEDHKDWLEDCLPEETEDDENGGSL